MQSPTVKITALVVLAVAGLTLLRFRPWDQKAKEETRNREALTVGYLPVT